MKRRRYQRGSVSKARGRYWIGLYYELGKRRCRCLGLVSEMTKGEARSKLDALMQEVRKGDSKRYQSLSTFLSNTYFPVYHRRWKESTAGTTTNRVQAHIAADLGELPLLKCERDKLQDFLDAKAKGGLSYSIVAHLRWDLNQIFSLAQSEGLLQINPAAMLNVPPAKRTQPKVMTMKQVSVMLSALDTKALLICKLGVLCGMRPGEIFGLQWPDVHSDHVEIVRRIYKGQENTPKTARGVRKAALSESTAATFESWRQELYVSRWVFPSENPEKPQDAWNFLHRHLSPLLKRIGLGWVNFQVMRRTHSSLMHELGQDAKARADQLGHTVSVNMDVYTQTSVGYRKAALETLEEAISRETQIA